MQIPEIQREFVGCHGERIDSYARAMPVVSSHGKQSLGNDGLSELPYSRSVEKKIGGRFDRDMVRRAVAYRHFPVASTHRSRSLFRDWRGSRDQSALWQWHLAPLSCVQGGRNDPVALAGCAADPVEPWRVAMSALGGATKAISLAEARRLGPRWVVQEKRDGIFARLCLNSQGRVGRGFSRSGREIEGHLLDGIRGALLGWPHAELIGELEAYTERSVMAIESRGQALVHLFDCLHDGSRSLIGEPYSRRRDAMCRMQAEVECYGPSAPWVVDSEGRAHERASGRYAETELRDWRVAPILPQSPIARIDLCWESHVLAGDGEGLVLVCLDAPIGARACKQKCKPSDTIDCEVREVEEKIVVCEWNGHAFKVYRGRQDVAVGDIVEVRHLGWYPNGVLPKHPSIVRVRRELH